MNLEEALDIARTSLSEGDWTPLEERASEVRDALIEAFDASDTTDEQRQAVLDVFKDVARKLQHARRGSERDFLWNELLSTSLNRAFVVLLEEYETLEVIFSESEQIMKVESYKQSGMAKTLDEHWMSGFAQDYANVTFGRLNSLRSTLKGWRAKQIILAIGRSCYAGAKAALSRLVQLMQYVLSDERRDNTEGKDQMMFLAIGMNTVDIIGDLVFFWHDLGIVFPKESDISKDFCIYDLITLLETFVMTKLERATADDEDVARTLIVLKYLARLAPEESAASNVAQYCARLFEEYPFLGDIWKLRTVILLNVVDLSGGSDQRFLFEFATLVFNHVNNELSSYKQGQGEESLILWLRLIPYLCRCKDANVVTECIRLIRKFDAEVFLVHILRSLTNVIQAIPSSTMVADIFIAQADTLEWLLNFEDDGTEAVLQSLTKRTPESSKPALVKVIQTAGHINPSITGIVGGLNGNDSSTVVGTMLRKLRNDQQMLSQNIWAMKALNIVLKKADMSKLIEMDVVQELFDIVKPQDAIARARVLGTAFVALLARRSEEIASRISQKLKKDTGDEFISHDRDESKDDVPADNTSMRQNFIISGLMVDRLGRYFHTQLHANERIVALNASKVFIDAFANGSDGAGRSSGVSRQRDFTYWLDTLRADLGDIKVDENGDVHFDDTKRDVHNAVLYGLIGICSVMPSTIMEDHLQQVSELTMAALAKPSLRLFAIRTLRNIMKLSLAHVNEHLCIKWLLDASGDASSSEATRSEALDCVAAFSKEITARGGYVPLRSQVVKQLRQPGVGLDDPRKMVRLSAYRCMDAWIEEYKN